MATIARVSRAFLEALLAFPETMHITSITDEDVDCWTVTLVRDGEPLPDGEVELTYQTSDGDVQLIAITPVAAASPTG